ncbi:fluoride efflux transporter FluC [Halodurantibacterium flavum]|uniref:Fluoride-specific ion channel FluC n=1 Tax=Halodurantibacterium flavum TaxID=1382802 RepID=A0ABW4S6A5_9RHOB
MAELLLVYLLIAAGGAIGGVARLMISEAVGRRWGGGFPLGTMVVNVTGAALIGLLTGVVQAAMPHLWTVLAVGVLGSFTTVSSFSLQTLMLMREGRVGAAAVNIAGSLALCLIAVALGYGCGRLVAGGVA